MSTPAVRNMSGYVYQDEASFDAPRVRRTAKNVANEALEGLERDTDEFAERQTQREAARIRVQSRAAEKAQQRRETHIRLEEAVQARREKRDLNFKVLQDAKRARQEARESKDRIEEGIRGEAAAARPQSRTLEIRNKSVATTVEGRREWKTQERPALVHSGEQDPVAAAALAESSPKADGAVALKFARSNVRFTGHSSATSARFEAGPKVDGAIAARFAKPNIRSTGQLAHAANSDHITHTADSSGTVESSRGTARKAVIDFGVPETFTEYEDEDLNTVHRYMRKAAKSSAKKTTAPSVPQGKGIPETPPQFEDEDLNTVHRYMRKAVKVSPVTLDAVSSLRFPPGAYTPHAVTGRTGPDTEVSSMVSQPFTVTTAVISGSHSAPRASVASNASAATTESVDKEIEKSVDTAHMNSDNGKKPAVPSPTKETANDEARVTKSVVNATATTHEAQADDDFALVSRKVPSADNGSRLPDPNVLMDELDMEFNSSFEGLKGWDDDDESDDGEEWDMGGLTEWKWIGEKSAAVSQTVGA